MNPLPSAFRRRSTSETSQTSAGARGRSRSRLLAGGGACLLALGLCGGIGAAALTASAHAAASGHAAVGVAALGNNWYESAPYYYAQDSSGPNLSQVMSATGQKAFE